MNELKEKLIQLEDELISLKKKIEVYHLIFLIIIMGIPIGFIFILNKFLNSSLTLNMKLILFSIMFVGLLVHLYIRNRFYKSHSGFNKYIKKRISLVKNDFTLGNNYKEKIIKLSSKILQDRGISLTEDKMSNYPFWELLIKNLNE